MKVIRFAPQNYRKCLIFQHNFNWLKQASKPMIVTVKLTTQTIIIHSKLLEKEINSEYWQE